MTDARLIELQTIYAKRPISGRSRGVTGAFPGPVDRDAMPPDVRAEYDQLIEERRKAYELEQVAEYERRRNWAMNATVRELLDDVSGEDGLTVWAENELIRRADLGRPDIQSFDSHYPKGGDGGNPDV